MIMAIRKFLKCRDGGMTVEFIAVMPVLVLINFFVIEIGLSYFWWQSVKKAAYVGARVAVVSNPAATGLPTINQVVAGGVTGLSCNDASAPCQGFAPFSCVGGTTGCDAVAFARISTAMQNIFPGINDENISITYTDIGLGFAGGPIAPAVTVTVFGVPFQTGFVSILNNIVGSGTAITTVPTMSSTLIGEDLNRSGA